MKQLLGRSWKKILVVVVVFSFVGLAAAVENSKATKAGETKTAATEKKSSPSEAKNRRKKRKKTAHETKAKGVGAAAAAQSEQVNEQDESNVKQVETTGEQNREGPRETSEKTAENAE
jgi:hypothetical protein